MLDLGGGGLNFRNAIINGNCRVAQRGSVSATNNAYTYGGADRIMAYPNSFSTFSGTLTQVTNIADTASKVAQGLTSVTTTGTGSIIFATRLEAKDCVRFAGRTVTISAKMYHEVTGGLGGAIQLYKANAADNFSGVTQINTTVNTGTIPVNTFTPVSATFTLGANDAANGLMVFWQFQAVGAVTGKTFAIGDLQMTEGTVVLPIEVPPIGYDDALCKRYFYQVGSYGPQALGTGFVYSATEIDMTLTLPVAMRATPAISQTTGASYYTLAGAPNKAFTGFSGAQNFAGNTVNLFVSGLSGMTGGQAGMIATTAAGASLGLTAEL